VSRSERLRFVSFAALYGSWQSGNALVLPFRHGKSKDQLAPLEKSVNLCLSNTSR
jgi:hypothetical protein